MRILTIFKQAKDDAIRQVERLVNNGITDGFLDIIRLLNEIHIAELLNKNIPFVRCVIKIPRYELFLNFWLGLVYAYLIFNTHSPIRMNNTLTAETLFGNLQGFLKRGIEPTSLIENKSQADKNFLSTLYRSINMDLAIKLLSCLERIEPEVTHYLFSIEYVDPQASVSATIGGPTEDGLMLPIEDD